jgi:hypothetical protein
MQSTGKMKEKKMYNEKNKIEQPRRKDIKMIALNCK